MGKFFCLEPKFSENFEKWVCIYEKISRNYIFGKFTSENGLGSKARPHPNQI